MFKSPTDGSDVLDTDKLQEAAEKCSLLLSSPYATLMSVLLFMSRMRVKVCEWL